MSHSLCLSSVWTLMSHLLMSFLSQKREEFPLQQASSQGARPCVKLISYLCFFTLFCRGWKDAHAHISWPWESFSIARISSGLRETQRWTYLHPINVHVVGKEQMILFVIVSCVNWQLFLKDKVCDKNKMRWPKKKRYLQSGELGYPWRRLWRYKQDSFNDGSVLAPGSHSAY